MKSAKINDWLKKHLRPWTPEYNNPIGRKILSAGFKFIFDWPDPVKAINSMKYSERFLRMIPWLYQWEGKTFEDDPFDKGGRTKFGIDQRSHPEIDIRHLTEEQATDIYWKEYWLPSKAENLPAGVGEVIFDISVNNGRSRAHKWLQEAVGVAADGIIGPWTLRAVSEEDPKALTKELLDHREQFYHSIAKGSQARYLRGWLNRNNSLRKFVS